MLEVSKEISVWKENNLYYAARRLGDGLICTPDYKPGKYDSIYNYKNYRFIV